MRRMAGIVFVLVALSGASAGVAQADHQSVRGEVVDLYVYLRDGLLAAQSAPHEDGHPMAVVDRATDTVYVVVPNNKSGNDPEAMLAPHMHEEVQVDGFLFSRGGTRAVVPLSVHPAGSGQHDHAH